MRAAMRAVLDGKQVAVLAPTTILAFQHWKTFRKRFAPFPVKVEMVSRFRTPEGDQGRPGGAGRRGRWTSSSAPTASSARTWYSATSGLLVVDEEQRFGVAAKERLKHAPHHRRLPDPLRHPHPAHPADGPRGHPRHVGHRDPAQGPPGHPDLDRQVLDRRHRGRDPPGAGPRRAGVLRPQPRGVHLLPGQPGEAPGARGPGGGGPRPDAGGASSRRRCWPSSRAGPTCWWPPPSSRTASTSRAPTPSS